MIPTYANFIFWGLLFSEISFISNNITATVYFCWVCFEKTFSFFLCLSPPSPDFYKVTKFLLLLPNGQELEKELKDC
jgi:hypothetical protein